MAHISVLHDKKQDLAHIADILLFEELAVVLNTAFSAWRRTVMPERIPVLQTGYVHVFMNTCYSSV
ncbi:MAG: hypothetical protein EGR88_00900 [Ruminococcus sp. SR1/5]|nr:hypothetical protein [Ruminococcus sp.]